MQALPPLRLPAQFGVRPQPDKLQRIVIWLAVDQHEVGPHVAVAMILPITCQRVIAMVPPFKNVFDLLTMDSTTDLAFTDSRISCHLLIVLNV